MSGKKTGKPPAAVSRRLFSLVPKLQLGNSAGEGAWNLVEAAVPAAAKRFSGLQGRETVGWAPPTDRSVSGIRDVLVGGAHPTIARIKTMPIEFRCTACDKLLRTPDETAGKQAKCPECGEITQIPVATLAPPPDAAPGSPFSSDVPPPDESTDPENPFQSPTDYTVAAGQMWSAGSPELYAYAMTRVSGPAVALIVVGALGLTLQVLGLIGNIIGLAMGGAGAGLDMMPLALSGGANIVTGAIGIVLSILVIMGGMQMQAPSGASGTREKVGSACCPKGSSS